MTRPRLLSPYPGAKRIDRYPVHDGGSYDAWIAPFAGSGEQESAIALQYPELPVVAADADFLVSSVWRCWRQQQLQKAVLGLIEAWSARIAREPEQAFSGLAHYASFYSDPAHQPGANLPLVAATSLPLVAATSILLRRLTFGGVIRLNQQGKLNVGLSQDKLRSFMAGGWEFTWPQHPQQLFVCDDWSEAVSFGRQFESAIAIVDPPYCTGTTAAYAHSDGTLKMALDCVERLLSSGSVARVVAFNYWGESDGDNVIEYPIVDAMQRLAERYSYPLHFSRLSSLATMNNASQGKIRRLEGVWEFGGKCLYCDRIAEQAEQLALI